MPSHLEYTLEDSQILLLREKQHTVIKLKQSLINSVCICDYSKHSAACWQDVVPSNPPLQPNIPNTQHIYRWAVHTYIHTYIHTYTHTTYVHTYTHTHTYINTGGRYIHTYIHTYILRTYVHTYIYMYIHTYTHTCIQ